MAGIKNDIGYNIFPYFPLGRLVSQFLFPLILIFFHVFIFSLLCLLLHHVCLNHLKYATFLNHIQQFNFLPADVSVYSLTKVLFCITAKNDNYVAGTKSVNKISPCIEFCEFIKCNLKNQCDIYCVVSVKCHKNIKFTSNSVPNLQQFTTSTPKVGNFDITTKDFN